MTNASNSRYLVRSPTSQINNMLNIMIPALSRDRSYH